MTWTNAVFGGFIVAAAAFMSAAGQEPRETRPKNVPFYTWVREDTFAGWMNNDPVRHARGMRRAQEFLDENPSNAEAINWIGTGKIFEATRAFEAGDDAKADALYKAGVDGMEKAVAMAPTDPGIIATTAGTLMQFARKLPDRHYQSAVEHARQHYATLYKMQESVIDRLALHLKGEALAGVAETEFRVGDREKGIEFLKRIVSGMPGTAYAQTAQTWLSAPESVTKQDRMVCQSCHEAGRLSSWMARQPK